MSNPEKKEKTNHFVQITQTLFLLFITAILGLILNEQINQRKDSNAYRIKAVEKNAKQDLLITIDSLNTGINREMIIRNSGRIDNNEMAIDKNTKDIDNLKVKTGMRKNEL